VIVRSLDGGLDDATVLGLRLKEGRRLEFDRHRKLGILASLAAEPRQLLSSREPTELCTSWSDRMLTQGHNSSSPRFGGICVPARMERLRVGLHSGAANLSRKLVILIPGSKLLARAQRNLFLRKYRAASALKRGFGILGEAQHNGVASAHELGPICADWLYKSSLLALSCQRNRTFATSVTTVSTNFFGKTHISAIFVKFGIAYWAITWVR
jgi:hypothetical protein